MSCPDYPEPRWPWKCFDCGQYPGDYYARDETWLAAWPDYAAHKSALARRFAGPERTEAVRAGRLCLLLCLDCLTRRLGRPLCEGDFDLALAVNQGIRVGIQIARGYSVLDQAVQQAPGGSVAGAACCVAGPFVP